MSGAPLRSSLLEITRHTPAKQQCTHLHDLTCLAVAHASRATAGNLRRRYDVSVPDRVERRTRCTLALDGEERLFWALEGLRIAASSRPRFEGLKIGTPAFREAMRAADSPDETEAAWVLQRAIFIGLGRQHDFDAMPTPRSFAGEVGGSCHAFAPERIDAGRRLLGNVHDFTREPNEILSRSLTNVETDAKRR